jgi:hypothetical protein
MDSIIVAAKKLLPEVEKVLDDPEIKGFLKEAKDIIEKLISGDVKKIDVKLTQWDDVNETLILAAKGAEVRAKYNKAQGVIRFLSFVLTNAARFAPVFANPKKGTKKTGGKRKKASDK